MGAPPDAYGDAHVVGTCGEPPVTTRSLRLNSADF
jgi:hypothetical protein